MCRFAIIVYDFVIWWLARTQFGAGVYDVLCTFFFIFLLLLFVAPITFVLCYKLFDDVDTRCNNNSMPSKFTDLICQSIEIDWFSIVTDFERSICNNEFKTPSQCIYTISSRWFRPFEFGKSMGRKKNALKTDWPPN